MKKNNVQRIEEEFLKFESSLVDEFDAVDEYISEVYDYFTGLINEDEKHIKYNKKHLKKGKRLGVINDMFGYQDTKYYNKEIEMLKLEILVIDRFRDCYERMLDYLDENNYNKIYKLAKFARYKFDSIYKEFKSVRDENKLKDIDINDVSEEFIEFFEKAIEEIE